jgi:hypothetical protein
MPHANDTRSAWGIAASVTAMIIDRGRVSNCGTNEQAQEVQYGGNTMTSRSKRGGVGVNG